jgi:glycosyltransferase involved in cell wall biosynthesis
MNRKRYSAERPIRSCLICFWEGYLGVAPSVVNAAQRFAYHGVAVDILMFKNEGQFAPPPKFHGDVRVIEIRRSRTYRRLNRLCDLVRMSAMALKLAFSHRYELAIGVDTHAFVAAAALLLLPRSRPALVYWSLELVFRHEIRAPVQRVIKQFEAMALPRAHLIVAQDMTRTELLRSDIDFGSVPVALIPNAPIGMTNCQSGHYLHDLLGIDRAARIVLHAGMICDAVMSMQLARAARELPDSHVLVFHEREKRDSDDPYLNTLKGVSGNRIKLSLNPVPLDQLDMVFSSARIGVVLYAADHGENVATVGFASGKLSYLLRNGIPVIVNATPALTDIIENAGCGVSVGDLSQIGEAIETIEARYELYRDNALKCFAERFEFGSRFDAAFAPWLNNRSKKPASGGDSPLQDLRAAKTAFQD